MPRLRKLASDIDKHTSYVDKASTKAASLKPAATLLSNKQCRRAIFSQ